MEGLQVSECESKACLMAVVGIITSNCTRHKVACDGPSTMKQKQQRQYADVVGDRRTDHDHECSSTCRQAFLRCGEMQ